MLWLTVAVALAGKPVALELTIVDAAGVPVTAAVVHFADEGAQTHRVHGETGTWAGDGLDLPSGERAPFTKGQTVNLSVSADGYADTEVAVALGGKRTSFVVTLPPAPAPVAAPETETEAPAAAPDAPGEGDVPTDAASAPEAPAGETSEEAPAPSEPAPSEPAPAE